MVYILPLVCLVIGLSLGGGLLYASRRMQSRLQCIEAARPCKAGSPVTGLVKMHGTVKAVNPDELLISPIEQRPCVYYRLVIERFHASTTKTTASVRPAPGSGSWERVIEDVQAIPMVVADETGEVSVDPKTADLDFQTSRRHANFLTSLPKELEQSLRERYKIVTSTFFIPKQMRYTEVVIAQDAEVFVVGDCEVKDGQASLTRKEHPLMMTFRTEQQVLRNGKITTTIFKIAAVAFPLLFLALAWFAYRDGSALINPHQNAAKAGGKEGAALEAIAKLKNNRAGLSERAWAARKLAETPVVKNQVGEVAPLLNPLLDSKDVFHRESAVLAIKQGWGSTVNQPALQRVLQSTTDARFRKEVVAAINRLGG